MTLTFSPPSDRLVRLPSAHTATALRLWAGVNV